MAAPPPQAALALKLALRDRPGDPLIRGRLLACLLAMGRHGEAVPLGEDLLAFAPEDDEVRFLLARARLGAGDAEGAARLFVGHPREAGLCGDLGLQAGREHAWAEAEGLFRRAMALAPWDPGPPMRLALALSHLARFQEALGLLEDTERRHAGDPAVVAASRFHQATLHLLEGRFETGWRLLEARLDLPDRRPIAPLPLAPWKGEPLEGRSILLRGEQGFGDMFMLARYASLLRDQGAEVHLEAFEGCQEVLATCAGVAGIPSGVVEVAASMLQAPVMSLPGLCGTTLASVPAPVPYLRVPDRVPGREAIDRLLEGCAGKRRLGLVWAGDGRHVRDADRSLPPELLDLLGDVEGVAWVSLQRQEGPRPGLPLVELGPLLDSFTETAYALSRLDGLVSVDTGVVHLAGAMGVPVWILVTRLPDWRWLLDREDSPWYPTARIWRQSVPGDWRTVVSTLADHLRAGRFPASLRRR